MWEKIEQIDWDSYKRPGKNSPDILPLIRGVVSKNWAVRLNAYNDLSREIESAYTKNINELPLVLVPILIDFLESEAVGDKLVITSLLFRILYYSETESLNEPFRSKAQRMREAVCKGCNTYRELLASITKNDTREELQDIIEICEST